MYQKRKSKNTYIPQRKRRCYHGCIEVFWDDSAGGSCIIIVLVVKSLIKSMILVLLQNIKTLKNNNLCVV